MENSKLLKQFEEKVDSKLNGIQSEMTSIKEQLVQMGAIQSEILNLLKGK